MRQLCYSYDNGCIRLIQTGFDQFIVQYGKQIEPDLSYAAAACVLGRVIMHSVACDGRLNSDEAHESEDSEPYFSNPVPAK